MTPSCYPARARALRPRDSCKTTRHIPRAIVPWTGLARHREQGLGSSLVKPARTVIGPPDSKSATIFDLITLDGPNPTPARARSDPATTIPCDLAAQPAAAEIANPIRPPNLTDRDYPREVAQCLPKPGRDELERFPRLPWCSTGQHGHDVTRTQAGAEWPRRVATIAHLADCRHRRGRVRLAHRRRPTGGLLRVVAIGTCRPRPP